MRINNVLFLIAIILNEVKAQLNKERKDRRILNGNFAKAGEFPFIVSLQVKYPDGNVAKFCGGVIIKPKWILTASHCYDEINKNTRLKDKEYYIKAGVVDSYVKRSPAQIVRVQTLFKHPYYNYTIPYNNDIALLKLEKALQYNKYVQPIELPSDNYIAKGVGLVLGWGSTDNFETRQSRYLQYATLGVDDPSVCRIYFGRKRITEKVLCLGQTNSQNACSGDSGGPYIQYPKPRHPVVVGILSYGTKGCWKEDPIVYTKITAYLGIIRRWLNIEGDK